MVATVGGAGVALAAASGAAMGAASGAIDGALTDLGIDACINRLAESLHPGSAALFLLVHKMTTEKVLDSIKGTGGVVLKTSLDRDKEEALRGALGAAAGPSPSSLPSEEGVRPGATVQPA